MHQLYDIYRESTRPTKMFTIPAMVLSAIALLVVGPNPTSSLSFLTNIMPGWIWSVVLLMLALIRTLELFAVKRFIVAEWVVPVLSVWVWSLILTAHMLPSPIIAMGLAYIVPISMELWFISQIVEYSIEKTRNNVTRRKLNES